MLNLKGAVSQTDWANWVCFFFFFLMCVPSAVGAQTVSMTAILNHFYLWSNQNALFPPTYRLHIFQNVIMQHSECLFLAHFVGGLPLLPGCCQRNTIEGVCCLSLRLSEMCSITPYSHWALNSPPSLILHRCSRRKLLVLCFFVFFFFFAVNECQEPGTILYKEMHKSALSKSWLWAHFLFPASPRPKK